MIVPRWLGRWRSQWRTLVIAAAVAGLTPWVTGSAAAHVTVDAPGAVQGGSTVLTFRVPTESEIAATTKLSVQVPLVTSARTEPVPGWTAKLDRNDKRLITTVTWTADPGAPGVPPGQFQRFVLSLYPLPKQQRVSFPTTQTYSDGTVINWNEPLGTNGKEPENPAPVLTLATSSGTQRDADDSVTAEAPAPSGSEPDTTARWLGGCGLVLGAAGAALGLGSTLRSRRP